MKEFYEELLIGVIIVYFGAIMCARIMLPLCIELDRQHEAAKVLIEEESDFVEE